MYPRTKSGIFRIQHGHAAAAAAAAEISLERNNSKNILLWPFKFGVGVHMGNGSKPIVRWPWPSRNRPYKGHLKVKIWVFEHILAKFSSTKGRMIPNIIYIMHIYVLYKHAKFWPLASFFKVGTDLFA